MTKQPEQPASAFNLVLTCLRTARGWSKRQLSQALGMREAQLSRYESGVLALSRETLDRLLAPLGSPPEAVELLLFLHEVIGSDLAEDPSLTPLTPDERQRIRRATLAVLWTVTEEIRRELIRRKMEEKAAAARQRARELWGQLKLATRQEGYDLVTVFPAFRSWALSELLCEASLRAAAHRADEARDLAELALFIADRLPGKERWHPNLQGYCWAHIGNARRVANDFTGADEAFARAWDRWRAGGKTNFFPEWRMLSLEASLRREQHRFPAALELLDRAKVSCGDEPVAVGRLLLKKEHVFERMGDPRGAVASLVEAAPFIEDSGDPRLLFALRFNMADNLCQLERYEEVTELLPRVRELAVEQGHELDLIRVLWLESKVDAGMGRTEKARVSLEQVRQDFTARRLPYDAALSSLELSALYLEQGSTAEVRELVVAMAWIFKAQGIAREALAALSLFRDAAQQETVTVELARRIIAEIEQARRSAPPMR